MIQPDKIIVAVLKMSREMQAVALWMFVKSKKKWKPNNPKNRIIISCYNNNRRHYVLLLAIYLLSLYSTHTEVNMGMKEFLNSSEHWYWLTSKHFLSETPCIIFRIEGLKDDRKNKRNFIVWGVCLFIKILVIPHLSYICWQEFIEYKIVTALQSIFIW